MARTKTLDQVAREQAVYDVFAKNTPGMHKNDERLVATFLRPDDACAFAEALPDKVGETVRVAMRGSVNQELMTAQPSKESA